MKLFLVLLAVTAASAYTFDFYEDYFTEAFVNYHNARSDVTWKVWSNSTWILPQYLNAIVFFLKKDRQSENSVHALAIF